MTGYDRSREPAGLLGAKLHIPRLVGEQVERPRLLRAMDRVLEPGRRLLLLSAPAGFGKTTALARWMQAAMDSGSPPGIACAWVSLDRADNDPLRFWTYVASAVRLARPDFGERTVQALRDFESSSASTAAALQPVLSLLLNELEHIGECTVIVLEDHHLVTASETNAGLSFVLDHLPENVRLVICTRVDPPLPVARLRAGDQLVELRAADLRFNAEEAARFLNASVSLPLDDAQIRALEGRTEGWIAGLKMAALALHGAPDAAAFVGGLTGSQRFILEYLTEEVLESQDGAVRDFLLRTSILDRLCSSLCARVTGRDDAGEMLETVRRRNLFLAPLDGEDRWYRYHSLFADLLRSRLREALPDLEDELHLKAHEWFLANGLPEEAYRHAIAGKALDRAVDVLSEEGGRLLFRGWVGTVQGWLDALPEQFIRRDLRSSLLRCLVGLFLNRWSELGTHLDETEALWNGVSANPPPGFAGHSARVEATLAILRSFALRENNELPQAIELARKATQMATEGDSRLQGLIWSGLGLALKARGELDQALEALSRAGSWLRADDNLTGQASITLHTVAILVAQGSLKKAWETCAKGLSLLAERGSEQAPAASSIYCAVAEVHAERGETKLAEEYWTRASPLAELTGDLGAVAQCALGRCRILLTRGQAGQALEILDRIEQKARAQRALPILQEVTARRVSAWIRLGRGHELLGWADEASGHDFSTFTGELEGIALVRACVAADRPREAIDWATKLLKSAEAGGRVGRVATLLWLQARAYAGLDERERAQTTLRLALERAAPEGIMRPFLEEGEEGKALLADMLAGFARMSAARGTRARSIIDLVRRLLDSFPSAPDPGHPSPDAAIEVEGDRHEPLTAREEEILQLLAAGHTNAQMAERLFISLATVKKHVSNILDKLGASNRTRAVAVARRLGLL